MDTRRPQEGDLMVCTKALREIKEWCPALAKGDRAVYVGNSQIKMLDGPAVDWVFTLIVTSPFALATS